METGKRYYEYMYELSPSEIYDGLIRGIFPEKTPPVFTAESFLQYAKSTFVDPLPSSLPRLDWLQYVKYENMRNLNRPRQMGIANPFGYERLCRCIKEHWSLLQHHFEDTTKNMRHKVSRLHVRKMEGSNLIFKMNYHEKAWNQDPVPDLRIGARYLVRSDISSCFPSIYTHSLPWALVGKDEAKANARTRDLWYNQIDAYTSCLRNGETTGLMIGNHASNLLSEIVLCKVDEELYGKGHRYIRNIDDYECYAPDKESAESFLVDLKDALYKYNLRINYEKTKIIELPTAHDDSWVRALNAQISLLPTGMLSRKAVEAFIGAVVDSLNETKNASVVYYAMKALSIRTMTEEARLYYVKYMAHLAAIYPYLYAYFDRYLFESFDVRVDAIVGMAEVMLNHGLSVCNYEESSYALYYALRYGFDLPNFDVEKTIATDDPVLKLMAVLYSRRRGLLTAEAKLVSNAEKLLGNGNDFDEQWVFCYETVSAAKMSTGSMSAEWKSLKAANVSFVRSLDEIAPVYTAEYEAERIDLCAKIRIKEEDIGLKSLVDSFRESLPAHAELERYEKYLNCVLANLWMKSMIRKSVSIPKDRSKYYYSEIIQFGEVDISIKMLSRVLLWLRENRYIGMRAGVRGEEVSRYWAREQLLKVFEEVPIDRIESIEREFSEVVLKDAYKNIVVTPVLPEKASNYKRVIAKINDLYSQHAFSCQYARRQGKDRFAPKLRSIFNNSSWDFGGRLYAVSSIGGLDYQCIPSDMRPSIEIDGKQTVELDYSGLHVNMLYADIGKQLSLDAYSFLPNEQRALAKFSMLVVLNAENEEQAIKALEYRKEELLYATGLSEKKENLRRAFILNDDMQDVVAKAKEAHPDIAHFFFSQYALKLQNRDSKLAIEILDHFADMGIPVLPVHDSFIVVQEHEASLRNAMDSVYSMNNNGFKCTIK